MSANPNRRDLLKLISAAAFAAPLALPAPVPGAPLFFTADEFALLDKLTDIVIPTDSHSPGAHDAGVAVFIDKTVAEAFLPEDKTSWRKGLALVNQLSQSAYHKPFLEASAAQQIAILKKMEGGGERHPEGEKEKFFGQLKDTTAFAYYSSKIGIHQDIEYKGNVILQEYVGYLPNEPLPPLSSLGSS